VRRHRWAGRCLLLVPGVLVVACDLLLRRDSTVTSGPLVGAAYAWAATLDILMWGSLVVAASACVAYDRDCRHTPFSNEAAPARLPLMQMRSVDSTTAISLGVLWSGIAPESGREALHSAPLVWEYAAAGVERSSANSLSTEKGAHSSEISPVGEASGEVWGSGKT
jgi:hypothetical protein